MDVWQSRPSWVLEGVSTILLEELLLDTFYLFPEEFCREVLDSFFANSFYAFIVGGRSEKAPALFSI